MQGPCPSNRSAPCFAPTGMEKPDDKMQLGSRWQNRDQLRSSVLAAAVSLMFLSVTIMLLLVFFFFCVISKI